jgi:hypothetical protein
MKPSDLLKKMVMKKRAEQPNGTIDDSLHLELEKQVSRATSQSILRIIKCIYCFYLCCPGILQ